jgi:hypothetical protein
MSFQFPKMGIILNRFCGEIQWLLVMVTLYYVCVNAQIKPSFYFDGNLTWHLSVCFLEVAVSIVTFEASVYLFMVDETINQYL